MTLIITTPEYSHKEHKGREVHKEKLGIVGCYRVLRDFGVRRSAWPTMKSGDIRYKYYNKDNQVNNRLSPGMEAYIKN